MAGSTSSPASMLPCTLNPSPTRWPLTGNEPGPVSAATGAGGVEDGDLPVGVLGGVRGAADQRRRASCRRPARRAARGPARAGCAPARPRRPRPGRALGTARPTARMQEETAIPRSPVAGSRARTEKVTPPRPPAQLADARRPAGRAWRSPARWPRARAGARRTGSGRARARRRRPAGRAARPPARPRRRPARRPGPGRPAPMPEPRRPARRAVSTRPPSVSSSPPATGARGRRVRRRVRRRSGRRAVRTSSAKSRAGPA